MKLALLKGFEDKNVTISSLPFVVGRCRSADFIIAHVNVSRNHCEIIKKNGLWKVKDHSSSGTYVNGRLVGKGNSVFLNDGDSIRFGPAETNLYLTFYSFDPSSEGSDSDITRHSESFSESNQKKCNSVRNNCICKEGEGNTDSAFTKKKKEIELKERNQNEKTQCRIINECSQYRNKELSHCSKQENCKDKSEDHKIQECTKELQEVQNIRDDLEGESKDLEKKITSETTTTTTTTVTTTNLLNNLTDLMESEFQCIICSELFVKAVTLSCAHTFCKYCISQWKKKQKTCPICRKKITTETRSLVVDNYIDKMVESLSVELKTRREAIIKERNEIEPCKKKLRKN